MSTPLRLVLPALVTLAGCASDAPDPPASQEGPETWLEAGDGDFGVDPDELGGTTLADEADYSDVVGPFVLELGAVQGSAIVEVRLARVLVSVEGAWAALPVSGDRVEVGPALGRWAAAWEGRLPEGRIDRVEVTLSGEAFVEGQSHDVPGPARELQLELSFDPVEAEGVVVLTGLLDMAVADGEVEPWLETAFLREIDDQGRPIDW